MARIPRSELYTVHHYAPCWLLCGDAIDRRNNSSFVIFSSSREACFLSVASRQSRIPWLTHWNAIIPRSHLELWRLPFLWSLGVSEDFSAYQICRGEILASFLHRRTKSFLGGDDKDNKPNVAVLLSRSHLELWRVVPALIWSSLESESFSLILALLSESIGQRRRWFVRRFTSLIPKRTSC
jgi:hypothetical protein